MNTTENKANQNRLTLRTSIIWIIIVTGVLYVIVASLLSQGLFGPISRWSRANCSSSMTFIIDCYAVTIVQMLFLILFLHLTKKNKYILHSFLPAAKNVKPDYRESDAQIYAPEAVDIIEIRKDNKLREIAKGLLIGFVMNFFCILCALLHGDIKLYFEFAGKELPLLIFAFICVFIQSSTEELWCRGFMYERLREHYPLWVSILVNGVVFGLLHIFNPGVSVIPILDIIFCGISFSLLKWYTGSIWTPMGVHTMWNFTQNFLFGLPNSGLVSEMSVFHLDAANGVSNLIYNFDFGVEGAIPGVFVDIALGVIVLILAAKKGRLGELKLSREQEAAMMASEDQA